MPNPQNLPKHCWKKGQSGNPAGRPSAGLSIKEWINQMQAWTKERVQAILDDPKTPVNKLAAARVWLHAVSNEVSTGGVPIAGSELDRIMDRTDGKPTQVIEQKNETTLKVQDDLSKLSDDELRMLRSIRLKLTNSNQN